MKNKRGTKFVILVGFGLILGILASVTVIWLAHIRANTAQFTDRVYEQKKAELLFVMLDAASQRALSLYRMSVLSDPFDQDEEYLYFRSQAERFIKARLAIVEQGETEKELVAWEKVLPLVQKGTANQAVVADLITDGKVSEATELMASVVIPNQNRVLAYLTEMVDLQKEHIATELEKVTEQNNSVFFQVAVLGFIALVLGGIIAFVVFRTTTKSEEDLIQAQKEAMDANKHKSLFLANMSHELRTPLNAIIGYSEMLEDDVGGVANESIASDLDKISGAGHHLLGLINDILDLTKIEAGKMEAFPENFNVTKLIKEITSTIQPLLDQNQNKLQVSVSEITSEVFNDYTKLRQTIFNLLSNACKFTTNGFIELTVSEIEMENKAWIEIIVKDTGIGMSDHHMDKLFDPFTQADASTTRDYGGTGLGLHICKEFCEMMDGYITVQSVEFAGSTFTVQIPAILERQAAVAS